jgi:putative aldouronate transport system permease protein
MPAVIFFSVFSYAPMVGVIIAFKRIDYVSGIFGSPWSGLENFRFLFINGQIFGVLKNTALYNLAFIVLNNFMQIAAAIFLTEVLRKHLKKFAQSLMFLPYFISWVVVGAFVYNIFNSDYGFLNSIMRTLNLPSINVYDKSVVWVIVIIFFCMWKNIGYGSVLYLAAISGIDQEMYEAARVDGANIYQRVWFITIPSLTPTIIILVLLSIGNIFRGDFSMFYQIVGDNAQVYNATDVIDTFVTRSLMQTREFGMSSAAAMIQSVLCFLVINIANYTVKKIDKDYALY